MLKMARIPLIFIKLSNITSDILSMAPHQKPTTCFSRANPLIANAFIAPYVHLRHLPEQIILKQFFLLFNIIFILELIPFSRNVLTK